MASALTEKKQKRILTKDKLIGMQVINSDGYVLGKVKELSLVVGESDQALIIEDDQSKEDIIRWSDVSAAGDVILLKPQGNAGSGSPAGVASPGSCAQCGAELEPDTLFCTSCGFKIKR